MRKLAHIEKIVNLEPIAGADRIEKATVLGWECVVKKGQFKIGDLCIYIEDDSIVPDTPDFEFMKERKFRVRTARFKKQIAQGLPMPVELLETFGYHPSAFDEGDDVTEILKIKKHDPQAEAEAKAIKKRTEKYPSYIRWLLQYPFFRRMFYRFGIKTKNFPVWLKKTDEERVQNIPHVFKQWNGQLCYFSEKVEGCVSKNTLIKTNLGDFTAKELYNFSHCPVYALSYNTEKKKSEYKLITNKIKNEDTQDWYEIELENGEKVILTGDHKIFISNHNKYMTVEELKDNFLDKKVIINE